MWTWIQLLQEVLKKVDSEQHNLMEDVMSAWKERGRGGAATNLDGTPSATATSGDGDSALPLGPGEWEEPLGLPLCVVCQNVRATLQRTLYKLTDQTPRPKRWNFWKRTRVGKNPTSIQYCCISEP